MSAAVSAGRGRFLRDCAFLCILEAAAFRLNFFSTGFYLDDWHLMDLMARAGGFFPAIGLFADLGGFWARPVQIIQIPLVYSLAAGKPAVAQAILAVLCCVEACLLYAFLFRLTRHRGLSLLAAMLAMLFPIRSVVHVWLSNASQLISHSLVLGAMILHHRAWPARRRGELISAQVLYAVALLCYESMMFLPLMLGAALFAEEAWARRPGRQAAAAALKTMLPFAATLFCVLSWQWVLMPRMFPGASHKAESLAFNSVHFINVFGEGLACLTAETVRRVWSGLKSVGPDFGLPYALGGVIFSLWAAFRVRFSDAMDSSERSAPWILFWAAAAAFVASYLPFAISGYYAPVIDGVLNRTNASAVWCGGALLAALFGFARSAGAGPRVRAAAAAALLAAFLAPDWSSGLQWAQAWRTQQEILLKMAARAAMLPADSSVLLGSAPRNVGEAVVFDAHWDFDSALRLRTGRWDLRGNIMTERVRFENGFAIEGPSEAPVRRLPYKNLFLYDFSADEFKVVIP